MRGAAAAPRPETPLCRRSRAAPRPALAPRGSGPRPRAAPARNLRSTFPSATLGAAAAGPGRRPEGRPIPATGLPAPLAPTPGTCEAAAGGRARKRGREEAAPLRPPGPAPRRKRLCVCEREREGVQHGGAALPAEEAAPAPAVSRRAELSRTAPPPPSPGRCWGGPGT